MDREDFFRLKRVQDKKKIEKEQKFREKELAEAASKAGGNAEAAHEDTENTTAIFDNDAANDEDLVF